MRALLVALPFLLSVTPVLAASSGRAVSEGEEKMASVLAADFARGVRLVRDPAIRDYVNRVAVRIARAANLEYPVSVDVFHDAPPRLAALPQGYFFLSVGLLAAVDSEAGLAAALAHQAAHLAARDHVLTHPAPRDAPGPLVVMYPCRRFPESSVTPAGVRRRQEEREDRADMAALAVLRKAGYDAAALASLYRRLAPAGAVAASTLVKLHEAAGAMPDSGETRVVTTDEFAAIQQRLPSLTPPKRPPSLRN